MKNKKIIKLIDPEPKRCYPNDCGYEKRERTGHAVYDLIAIPTFIPAPRNIPQDYVKHNMGCLWAQWAMREIARKMK